MVTDVVQEIETLLGRQVREDLDLEALELAVRQQVLQLAGCAVEQRLNADTSDERGSRTPCGCGQEARYVGRRVKQVQSVLGPLRLERAYYHCSSCAQGFCPRDQHLGIEKTSLSPALTRMVGTVGALVSFQEGSELLTELAGVRVDAKQVERTAEALGEEIAEDERVRNPAMKKARPSAMKGRSPTRRPWRAPPRWTPLPHARPSPNASGEKQRVAASAKRSVGPCLVMVLRGSGISRKISFL